MRSYGAWLLMLLVVGPSCIYRDEPVLDMHNQCAGQRKMSRDEVVIVILASDLGKQ